MAGSPRISIITPSFRSGRWLKLCMASVADQGVACEHIVQDSCSDDGTQDWLPKDARVQAFIEKDRGMYDAVNRGLKRSRGEICAYLNCDEQYLPGALQAVLEFFDARPEVEVAFADTVVIQPDGRYLCHRKTSIPGRYHTLVSADLSFFTSSTFFRRRVFAKRGLFFNANLKDVGDADWGLRLIAEQVAMARMGRFTSAFTETGANMNTLPNALREKQAMFESAPAWARRARPLIVWHYRLRKLLAGAYAQRPFDYAVYTEQSPAARVTFHVARPTTRWRR
jgi:glycosyltransferase involved in cell wall biosynthesis